MCNFPELFFNGAIQRGMAVPMKVRPDGSIGIEILSPATVPHRAPLPSHDHDRLLDQPIFHLRERMPDELLIQLGQILHSAMLKIALGWRERIVHDATTGIR